jgi:hypothetical protein
MFSAVALMAAAVSSPSLASTSSSQWPAGTLDKEDPQVLAFYGGLCSRYADDNGLRDAEREAYLAKCRTAMPAVFPVGYEEGGGGGEE